jgi:hypothetical protein
LLRSGGNAREQQRQETEKQTHLHSSMVLLWDMLACSQAAVNCDDAKNSDDGAGGNVVA